MLKLKLQQFAAPGHTSPIRADGFKNLQLNAGIFIKNLDYSSIANAGALKTAIESAITAGTSIIGMTRGGGSFTVSREIREPDVDGRRYPFKGGKFVDSIDPSLSTSIVEMTVENLKMALGTGRSTGSSPKTTITMDTAIDDSDYIDTLTWYGDLADGGYVAITLFNALNTSDLNMTFTDKGEAVIPVEFHAHQDDVNDYDSAPFEIVFFRPAA